jgi:hypothetical protein
MAPEPANAGTRCQEDMTRRIDAGLVAAALTGYLDRVGAVSALAGAIHYGSGIFGSAVVGVFARWYALAHGLGDRAMRAGQPREHAAAAAGTH